MLDDLRTRLLAQPRPFLLESGANTDGCGGRLYAGAAPSWTFEWSLGDGGDPLAELEQRVMHTKGIAVGYLGYGLGAYLEPSVAPTPHPIFPDLAFSFYDAALELDLATGSASWHGDRDAVARLESALMHGQAAAPGRAGVPEAVFGELAPDVSRAAYEADIERLLGEIRAGGVYQVNYTYRLRTPFRGSTSSLYAISLAQRAPFGGYLDLGQGRALVSASPERFLAVADGRVESRPIKGTAGKGTAGRGTAEVSEESAQATLRASEKDRAEHVMIVDVARNDLGRVCVPGTVTVDDMARPVAFPSLHHLISTVAGTLREGVGLSELLRATFPGASVTGAPKVRAMQLTAGLEASPRGPYTGAFGRIGPLGPARGLELDLAMTIRTMLAWPGHLELGVGGGIVADSTPEAEWREAQLKASAWGDGLKKLKKL